MNQVWFYVLVLIYFMSSYASDMHRTCLGAVDVPCGTVAQIPG